MHLIDIKGSEVFKLASVTIAHDSNGKERLCANYELLKGPKGSLKIVFEGYVFKNHCIIKPQYKFKSLLKMYDDRRIYLQGVHYLDGQFEKPVDTENKE